MSGSGSYDLHPDAYTDLDGIWEFIAEDNLDAADRVIAEIRTAMGNLALFPHQGHRRDDLTARPLLFWRSMTTLSLMRRMSARFGYLAYCMAVVTHVC